MYKPGFGGIAEESDGLTGAVGAGFPVEILRRFEISHGAVYEDVLSAVGC